MSGPFNEKNFRSAIYCECIMGAISSILAIIGLIFVFLKTKLDRPWAFNVSLTFWISYLIFSISIIILGIYSAIQEKNYNKRMQRENLKAPLR